MAPGGVGDLCRLSGVPDVDGKKGRKFYSFSQFVKRRAASELFGCARLRMRKSINYTHNAHHLRFVLSQE